MSKAAKTGALTIECAVLRAALKDVVGVVEARNTTPILSNVMLTATQSGSLEIIATDLDMQVTRTLHAAVDAPFSITVEARLLDAIAAKLPKDAQVSLSLADGRMTIVAGRARFTLGTLPVEDFPTLATGADWAADFEIDALVLGGAIDRIAFAMSTEETRYYLNGVFVHGLDDSLRLATTDGHRLARMTLDRPEGADALPDVILPRKAVRALDGLLDRHEGAVGVSVSKSRLAFEIGATTLVTKTIDGTFPDYSRVVPSSNDRLLAIDRQALIDAVERVATIATEKTRAVKLTLARDVATLSCSSAEHGTALEEVPCMYGAAGMEIGFNAKYLLELLGRLTADTIDVALGDPAAPTLWRDTVDAPAIFVLMPMRV